MSDAELIFVAGALLAVGIAAAKVADRVRIPGCSCSSRSGCWSDRTVPAGWSSMTPS